MKELVEKFVNGAGIKGGYVVVDEGLLRNLSRARAIQTFDNASKNCHVWQITNGQVRIIMSK